MNIEQQFFWQSRGYTLIFRTESTYIPSSAFGGIYKTCIKLNYQNPDKALLPYSKVLEQNWWFSVEDMNTSQYLDIERREGSVVCWRKNDFFIDLLNNNIKIIFVASGEIAL